jgi:hypothetical protein
MKSVEVFLLERHVNTENDALRSREVFSLNIQNLFFEPRASSFALEIAF